MRRLVLLATVALIATATFAQSADAACSTFKCVNSVNKAQTATIEKLKRANKARKAENVNQAAAIKELRALVNRLLDETPPSNNALAARITQVEGDVSDIRTANGAQGDSINALESRVTGFGEWRSEVSRCVAQAQVGEWYEYDYNSGNYFSYLDLIAGPYHRWSNPVYDNDGQVTRTLFQNTCNDNNPF